MNELRDVRITRSLQTVASFHDHNALLSALGSRQMVDQLLPDGADRSSRLQWSPRRYFQPPGPINVSPWPGWP